MSYLEKISNLFSVKDVFDIVMASKKAIRQARGQKREMLAEVKYNLEILITLYLQNDAHFTKVIGLLKNKAYTRLSRQGFNFNSFKKNKLGKRLNRSRLLSVYITSDLETILTSAYEKIEVLKVYSKTYKNNPADLSKVRFDVRLKNILQMLALIALLAR